MNKQEFLEQLLELPNVEQLGDGTLRLDMNTTNNLQGKANIQAIQLRRVGLFLNIRRLYGGWEITLAPKSLPQESGLFTTLYGLVRSVSGLHDSYPVLNDDIYHRLETEAKQNAWLCWGRIEVLDSLARGFGRDNLGDFAQWIGMDEKRVVNIAAYAVRDCWIEEGDGLILHDYERPLLDKFRPIVNEREIAVKEMGR